MTSQPDRLNRRHLLLGSAMLASGVHASDELTGGDPLGSMQWPTLRKQYLGQAPMRFAPEVVVRGRDEISQLAESFNRMRRSLANAMKMLGD